MNEICFNEICLHPENFYFPNSGSHGRQITWNYFQPKGTFRIGSGVITKKKKNSKKPFSNLRLLIFCKNKLASWEIECKGERGIPQRKGEHHLLSTRSSERGNWPFLIIKHKITSFTHHIRHRVLSTVPDPTHSFKSTLQNPTHMTQCNV